MRTETRYMMKRLNLVRRQGRASISMLQRRLRIGYTPRRPLDREHARERDCRP